MKKINKYLKQEIITFLNFEERIKIVSKINKIFLNIFNKLKYMTLIKENYKTLMLTISFRENTFELFRTKYLTQDHAIKDFEENFFYDIYIYLLQLKYKEYKDESDLDLSGKIESMKIFFDVFKKFDNIKKLNLRSNNIGLHSEDVKFLSKVIRVNKNLEFLNLGLNKLGENSDNLKYLGEMLKENNTIIKLILTGNNIGASRENVKCICDGIRKSTSLQVLYISDNQIGNDSLNVKYLLDSTVINKNLQAVFMQNNELFDRDYKLIKKALNKKKYLKIFY